MEYKIIAQDGRAKRAQVKTVHGTIQTPVFMNVGTVAAIKGAVSTDDLRMIGTQVELSNTYHLHVRTGDSGLGQTDQGVWRASPVYELGQTDPYGLRRVSGVFPGRYEEDQGRGRVF